MKVLDLFCGCGGLSLGFYLAGFDIVGGVDINKNAIETFNKNFINAKGICYNLLDIKDNDIEKLFPDIKEIDVIIGGPPCQGFSSANRCSKEIDDPRNKLFFEFVKFVRIAQPKVVLIENVRGILTKDNGYAKNRITSIFNDLGYNVSNKVLNAADYGVPQKRYRNFFIITKDVQFDFNSIKKVKKPVTLKEALEELYLLDQKTLQEIYTIENEPDTDYRRYLRKEDNTIHNHQITYPTQQVQERMNYVPQGGNWKDIPPEMFTTIRDNRHSSAYKRLKEDEPSITIDTGHGNYFHPLYNRVPTVRESARIQSFPDWFIFCGSKTSQFKQVENAVPPLLAKALAEAIKEVL